MSRQTFEIDRPSRPPELNELFEEFQYIEELDQKLIQVAYESIQERYGDSSLELYRPYHNHVHGLNVTRRGQVMWRALQAVLPEQFTNESSRYLAIGSMFHDYDQDQTEPTLNELNSAEVAADAMWYQDGFYSVDAVGRVADAIITTIVERDEQGSIIQTRIRMGSKDPVKFVLALADINGIAMGGVGAMVEDSINLFMELNGYKTSTEVLMHAADFGKFLQGQAKFLRERLANIDSDVNYYFEDDEERAVVKNVLAELFQPGAEALRVASILEKPGEVVDCIDALLRGSVSTVAELKDKLLSFLPGQTES